MCERGGGTVVWSGKPLTETDVDDGRLVSSRLVLRGPAVRHLGEETRQIEKKKN